jgi:hypothetical protein
MSIILFKAESPDPTLQKRNYEEGQLARLAHVNELADQIKSQISKIEKLGDTVSLTTAWTTSQPIVESRLDAIEAKLDAIITALS